MASFLQVVNTRPQNNAYLDALISDQAYQPGTTIQLYPEAEPNTSSGLNGKYWESTGALTALTAAAATWSAVADVTLKVYPFYKAPQPAGTGGDILGWTERLVFTSTDSHELGLHTLPGSSEQYGEYNRASSVFTKQGNAVGGYSFVTFLHELGHGLGLDHPIAFPGVTSDFDTGNNGLNQGLYTVMSYNDGYDRLGDSPSVGYGWSATPMAFDIAAVQAIYGPNMSTNAGDNDYVLPGSNQAGTSFACIWDAGGTDTLDGAGLAANCTIDLRAATLRDEVGGGGFLSSANHIFGGFTIAAGVTIENAIGGSGNDMITGNAVDNMLTGGSGDDTLAGGDGNDVLIGGAGDDYFDGGHGADRMYGGSGTDHYIVDSQSDLIFEDASPPNTNTGQDVVTASVSFYLYANIESLVLADYAGNIFGVGNDLDNNIEGNRSDNLLLGGAGDDHLFGEGGNDILYGENGGDTIQGGDGIDVLIGGDGNDYLLGDNGADAIYGGDGDDQLTGGQDFSTDILYGGNGNDLLDMASGQGDYDIADGGAGDDVYLVDTPNDLTYEAAGGGADRVIANISGAGYYLYANVEDLVLDGTTPFGVGNELDNKLQGNASANYLLGGAGNDTLNGLGGNDVLFGEAGADTFAFYRGTGGDVIGDFAPGTDHIDLRAFGFTSFANVQAAMVEVGGTTAINLASGDFIVINGIANAALHGDDFILV